MREAKAGRIAAFVSQIEYESRALGKDEASYLLSEVRIRSERQEWLQDPIDEDRILLHHEAADTLRINSLVFSVAKVQINADALTPWDMQTHLEVEEFKLAEDSDQELGIELGFGSLPTKHGALTILAD